MNIRELRMDCEKDGETGITIWATCDTPQDIDAMIEWMKLGKQVMRRWKQIYLASLPDAE